MNISEVVQNTYDAIVDKRDACIDYIQESDISWKIAGAALALKGFSYLTQYAPRLHLVGATTNALGGSALLYNGIKEYQNKNVDLFNNPSALLKIAIGSGLLCLSVYELLNFFYPSTTSSPTISSKFIHDITKDRIVAIGDVHGDLNGLKENLRQAGLIDINDNWIGGTQTLVQVGDIVDRGPQAEEAWNYLGHLQKQARNANGKVIRLIGNHELMWLEGDFRYAAPQDSSESKARVVKEITKNVQSCWNNVCDAQAAYISDDGKVAFLHAGLVEEMDQLLRKEIIANTGKAVHEISNGDVIERINEITRKAFSFKDKPDFSHPIFNVGAGRGGKGVDGIFWADKPVLDSNAAQSLVQIVGHNPPRGAAPISVDPNQRVVYADAGMLGGNRCFVEIVKNKIYSQCKNGKEWLTKVL